MDQTLFLTLLTKAVAHGVSDIHLQPGSPPAFRLHGDLMNVKGAPLTEADLLELCRLMIQDRKVQDTLGELQEYDGSFEVKNVSRFRVNIYRYRGKLGAILRVISAKIPTIQELGLSRTLQKIALMQRGLVLVTGATGSGKSSTLAAMIDHINTCCLAHVVTIEDPVEFLHPQRRSRITQREVGRDTGDFAVALRAALRQDPDVILVGEMRDAETIDVALKAAETGHMVFSTVHTTDAIKTIGRLIAVFPANEQDGVRARLAENLVATVSQRLLKRASGKGLVAAQEIMVTNRGIQDCIAKAELTGSMNDFIAKSHGPDGGQTFDQHLVELYRSGAVTLEEAQGASNNPTDFARNLMYGSDGQTRANRGEQSGSLSVPLDRKTGLPDRGDAA